MQLTMKNNAEQRTIIVGDKALRAARVVGSLVSAKSRDQSAGWRVTLSCPRRCESLLLRDANFAHGYACEKTSITCHINLDAILEGLFENRTVFNCLKNP